MQNKVFLDNLLVQFIDRYPDVGQYTSYLPVCVGVTLGKVAHSGADFAVGASVVQIGI